ncbi:DUF2938 domain-containing protein [Microbulbifer hainanensis]|uniref:DUF2938 domain-containing protein n=1 Tax=Microbulbifer hainanensis TaxID=2735675 RepID=UPI001865B540|nr:DUF2938 domain-containing protein [Microbulbifer hainanensis]
MHNDIEFALRALLIGAGATLLMDGWALLLRRCFAVPSLDWSLVGRWIGHLPQGRVAHGHIGMATPVRGEAALGWLFHYAVGIALAALLLVLSGPGWALQPTLVPALLFGVLTVAAPFLILQPGMGAGIAAAKTPQPSRARLRSVATHTVFGLGLYLSARILTLLPL